MAKLAAFVGHSFLDGDRTVIDEFLGFFNRVQGMGIGFSWVHAEAAEPKALSAKILQLIEGKNVFIGICTIKEKAIDPTKLRPTIFRRSYLAADAISFEAKASDWVIQEIGLAIGRNMDLIILLEDGLRLPGGLQGNVE